MPETQGMDDIDLHHLRRCVELAEAAVEDGDEPFGSVLVGAEGQVLREERNHVGGGDRTQHPERARATVYTSGEHCPMCAAAHAWVGLGRIVYASSAGQLTAWSRGLGLPPSPVQPLPIRRIAPELRVEGPCAELAPLMYDLHRRRLR